MGAATKTAAAHFTAMGQAATEGSAFGVPAGTVTFLMTDLEASRRLWENARTVMPEAIARHGGVRP